MDSSHSLTLNEQALAKIPEAKRPIFVYEWLRFLDKILPGVSRPEIKECQKTLVNQLITQIQQGSPGPPTRLLLAKALTTIFTVGDTFLLFDTINKCNDILKNKDDSPSYLPTRLTAICVVGVMYEKLGRMTGRSYEETVTVLSKGLKNAESQTRTETMITFGKVCTGLGSAASNIHREIYKSARTLMSDRVMTVRAAAAKCLLSMAEYATFLHTTELDNVAQLCFRAFDGAQYETRISIARLLGNLLAMTQQNPNQRGGMLMQMRQQQTAGQKSLALDDALAILMQGFLKGGSGSSLIKGGSAVSQEARVGVTHCYVIMVQTLGGVWLERNLGTVLGHVLELVSHPKAATSHVDAVYSRRCVGYIVQILLGKTLGEKTQLSACKEIVRIIGKLMSTLDVSPENGKDNQETMYSQHMLVVALQELGSLVQRLGTVAKTLISDSSLRLADIVLSVLLHPCHAPRLAAAWCLRSLTIAVPSYLTPAIDRCLEGLENLKSSAEAVSGHSAALAALLGAVRSTPLGIPHTRGKIIFNVGEELLRSASQNSRLSRERTQAGWLLIGAIMTLGPAVVKGLLPRMMLLWRNAFPRSPRELESERARGDAFTWKVSLEARAGALATMHSFLQNSPDLLTDDIIRRISVPVESALTLLCNASTLLKSYQNELKALTAMVRLRLFETLSLLPPTSLEGSYTQLLRLLVAEFTLADGQSNTSTSLLRSLCHSDDSVILGTRFQDTEDCAIEEQLLANSAAGSGALEHDLCCLYRPLPKGTQQPGPLPLGVGVVDMSIVVFGVVFPRVAQKHRLQMLDHFSECVKQAKGNRLEAIQMNIFTAVLSGLKGLAESKGKFGTEEVKKSAVNLILSALTSSNSTLRCAAGEALGRMAQVVSDSKFVAEMAQNSFDCLKSARDVISRTGHSLALGCLHRYVGGMGSSQHLRTSVSILLALAEDNASPQVQVWALHALALIADSGGPMFRSFVEPTLSTTLKLLMNVPASSLEVMICLGRVMSALITTLGPELQANSVAAARSSLLCACGILQHHPHPVIQAEAILCLQQLHMFAPEQVDLGGLVPTLCHLLRSSHLVLRKSAVSCLRQFAQREAKEVCEHALALINQSSLKETHSLEMTHFQESGLPGMLFAMLDHEMDVSLISHLHDTINSIMLAMAADNLTSWLALCREVLTVSTEDAPGEKLVVDDEKDDDTSADDEQFTTGDDAQKDLVQPRWPTRVFAAQCLRRIIEECCHGNRAHFDLGLAKEMQLTQSRGDYLVLHLSELVRVAFMAATSDSDPLRLEGLKTLEVIIDKFGETPEPEFPGHVILEQYQAQVGAALRPAFGPETASHVTSAACDVCSAWIGSGVARDLGDLRRVYQLLVTSLSKLRKGSQAQIYNESALTLEKLSILKAWAEVYIVSMKNETGAPTTPDDDDDFGDFESGGIVSKEDNLATLVQTELPSLSKHWIAALKDHALLSLPKEFKSQLPYEGGAFYTNDTIESARPHYRTTWPPILHAAAIWLAYGKGFDNVNTEKAELDVEGSANLGLGPANAAASKDPDEINADRFHLLFGVCMEALSNSRSTDLSKEQVTSCLKALKALMDNAWAREAFGKEPVLMVELCNVLHRTVLTQDQPSTQLLVMQVLHLVLEGSRERLEAQKKKKLKEMVPANQEPPENLSELDLIGEGGSDGVLQPGRSVVFATLEVCLCVLIRYYPDLSPRATNLNSVMAIQAKSRRRGHVMSEDQAQLISLAASALAGLPDLCSPQGAIAVLPSILFLITGVLKEAASKRYLHENFASAGSPQIATTLQALKTIVVSKYSNYTEDVRTRWNEILQSGLLRVLDLAKTAPEDDRDSLDEVSLLLAISVFLLHGQPEVVTSPNIKYPSINAYTQCLQSEDPVVRHRCVQTLTSIFQHPNKRVSVPYIQSLAPRILEYLCDESSKRVKTDTELALTLECVRSVEVLLAMTGKQELLLRFLIPILVNYLLVQDELKDASRLSLGLHDKSLGKLTQIGQQYPAAFKQVLTEHESLKERLESAAKANQQRLQSAKHEAAALAGQRKAAPAAPSIKLKMDFSNFAAK